MSAEWASFYFIKHIASYIPINPPVSNRLELYPELYEIINTQAAIFQLHLLIPFCIHLFIH